MMVRRVRVSLQQPGILSGRLQVLPPPMDSRGVRRTWHPGAGACRISPDARFSRPGSDRVLSGGQTPVRQRGRPRRNSLAEHVHPIPGVESDGLPEHCCGTVLRVELSACDDGRTVRPPFPLVALPEWDLLRTFSAFGPHLPVSCAVLACPSVVSETNSSGPAVVGVGCPRRIGRDGRHHRARPYQRGCRAWIPVLSPRSWST